MKTSSSLYFFYAISFIIFAGLIVMTEIAKTRVALETELAGSAVRAHRVSNAGDAGEADTANWQTYRSEEYGFEFRYPADWIDDPAIMSRLGITQGVSDVGRSNKGLGIVYKPEESQCGQGVGCFYPASFFATYLMKDDFLPSSRSKSFTFEQFVQAYEDAFLRGPALSRQFLTIGGRRGAKIFPTQKVIGPASALVPQLTVIIEHSSSSIIWIEGDYSDEYREYAMPTLDAILSTFKFIKQRSISADLCVRLSGATFQSMTQHERGEGPDGKLALGYWSIRFAADGSFSWFHSDVGERGEYSCVNGMLQATKNGMPVQISYDEQSGILTWAGVTYRRQ